MCARTVAYLNVVALLAAGPAAGLQNVVVQRLDRGTGTIAEPFTAISGLRELSDGRVLVTDMAEGRLRIVDFRNGGSVDIGRNGRGPGEFERPNALYAAAGDTTRLLDVAGRRLLTVLPDGRMSDQETRLRMISGGFKPPRGMDVSGRLYIDLGGIFTSALAEAARTGRMPLLRSDATGARWDTVTVLSLAPMSGGGSGPVPPYRPEDAWAVDRSGRVAIVRHDPYRVEWFVEGRRIAGHPVDWRPVRIGSAEREAYLDRLVAGASGITITQNGERRTMRPPRPDASSLDWPATMPPFEGPAWIAADHVWVRRNRSAREERPLYDGFDASGRLARQIELPAGRVIVGTGERTLYAVRTDEFGLLWLERYEAG